MRGFLLKSNELRSPHQRERMYFVWLKSGPMESVCDNHLQAWLGDTDRRGKRRWAGDSRNWEGTDEGKHSLRRHKHRNVPGPGSTDTLKQICR